MVSLYKSLSFIEDIILSFTIYDLIFLQVFNSHELFIFSLDILNFLYASFMTSTIWSLLNIKGLIIFIASYSSIFEVLRIILRYVIIDQAALFALLCRYHVLLFKFLFMFHQWMYFVTTSSLFIIILIFYFDLCFRW